MNEEMDYQAEQDALAGEAAARQEEQDRGEYEAQMEANAQAEYEASQGPEEYGPEGE